MSINGKDTEHYVHFVSFCKQKEAGEKAMFVVVCIYMHEEEDG